MVTEHAWGAIWARPGLSKKQRSLLNLGMLAALNRPEEFELHFRGALKNGCTIEELKETLLQIAVYCGMPAGVGAFRIARKVLASVKSTDRPEGLGAPTVHRTALLAPYAVSSLSDGPHVPRRMPEAIQIKPILLASRPSSQLSEAHPVVVIHLSGEWRLTRDLPPIAPIIRELESAAAAQGRIRLRWHSPDGTPACSQWSTKSASAASSSRSRKIAAGFPMA